MTRSTSARLRLATLLAVPAVALAGCGGEDTEQASASGDEPVELVVSTFGNFGYGPLLEEYVADNPGVTVVEQEAEFNQHHEQLAQRLAGGSGAGDVVGIDEGFITQFKANPDQFVNLLDMGAAELEDQWLPWKWQQSMAGDGAHQIGLGTDVGGLAMCYRTDLFEAAGLPTDRAEVSALWPTWDDFITVGTEFEAAGTDASFVDSATNVFNPILMQQEQGYYNDADEFIAGDNPGVREAWDLTTQIIDADASAGLTSFSPEWNDGFKSGSFATLACPAWMMGYIQDQAPDTAGNWDIAAVPGGGGNWGGSFLAVPAQSEHPEQAYELAAWLTAPEQQARIFTELGNLPSQPELYNDPAVADFTNDFFNEAPVGEIFTSSAEELVPQYLGSQNGPVRTAFENALREVENGNLVSDEAWQRGLADAERAAG